MLVHLPADRPDLIALFRAHPEVEVASSASSDEAIRFGDRALWVGRADLEVAGLVETMDNNPLVCAAEASLPSAISTLALVALGPLAQSGLAVGEAALTANAPIPDDLQPFLDRVGWHQGLLAVHAEADLGRVLAVNVMAEVQRQSDWQVLDELYQEPFDRTFYVRRSAADWHANQVHERPWAVYDLRLTADEGNGLLTVRVMADQSGKCGAAQVVHAFNVMNGFEECLGIPDQLS